MRTVSLAMNISLDGYVAGPAGELDWIFQSMDPELTAWVTGFLRGVDTVIIGSRTYLEQAAMWPTQSGEMADLLNSHQKIVFSKTLQDLTWANSRLASGDPLNEVERLKATSGKNLFVTGGATMARSMLVEGLIDDYHLAVHPVLLGQGRSLLADLEVSRALVLVSSRTFPSGTVHLTYRRA